MVAKAIIMGRVGSKDEMVTKANTPMCKLSIATDRRWTNSRGEREKETTWHSVTFFDKISDVAKKYVNVGDMIYVEGNIQYRKVEKDGESKFYYSVQGTHLELMPNKQEQQGGQEQQAAHQPVPAPASSMDDVPF